MSTDDAVADHLLRANEAADKSYAFDEEHDPSIPADWWFQESDEGLILFVVFYSMACRWSLCTACNLPSVGSTRRVELRALTAQVDWIFAHPEIAPRRSQIRKLIVSNNGSVLDELTFSSTALMYLLAQCHLQLPALAAISLETRAEYVDAAEIEFLHRAMNEPEHPIAVELAIGFEAYDSHLRNKLFMKGLSNEVFEDLLAKLAPSDVRLKCYFMQKPVASLTDEEAVEDVQRGIDYLSAQATRTGVPISLHLNPTYAARGTELEVAFRQGRYQPPRLADVARAVLHARGKGLPVFVGMSDEGLAVDGGSFLRPGEEALVERFEAFNRSQDFELLVGL